MDSNFIVARLDVGSSLSAASSPSSQGSGWWAPPSSSLRSHLACSWRLWSDGISRGEASPSLKTHENGSRPHERCLLWISPVDWAEEQRRSAGRVGVPAGARGGVGGTEQYRTFRRAGPRPREPAFGTGRTVDSSLSIIPVHGRRVRFPNSVGWPKSDWTRNQRGSGCPQHRPVGAGCSGRRPRCRLLGFSATSRRVTFRAEGVRQVRTLLATGPTPATCRSRASSATSWERASATG